jgi:hypothetical protein
MEIIILMVLIIFLLIQFNQFKFLLYLNLILDENLKIIVMMESDVYDVIIKNRLSYPFLQ